MPSGPITTGADTAAYARVLARERRRKQRRRFVALAVFLALGLAMGAIYATGFATNSGATDVGGSEPASPVLTNPGNNQDTSGLNALLTAGPALQYTWSGRTGRFASSQVMFTADLTTEPLANTYYVSVYQTDPPVGFSDIQLQLRIAPDGAASPTGSCTGADLDTATTAASQRVMTFDTNDTQVTFAGVAGQDRYCIGVANYAGNGGDTAGTFIRRANSSIFPSQYPGFVSTLNRSS